MPFEFIQIPANGQGNAKDALNKLLQAGRIASVRKEFVANGEDSFWAFWEKNWALAIGLQSCATGRQLEQQRQQLPRCEPQQQQPGQLQQQQRFPGCPQLRPGLQPDRAVVSMGLNRSVPGSRRTLRRDEVPNAPLGASSTVDTVSNAPSGDLPTL